jgi:hypothetical protein
MAARVTEPFVDFMSNSPGRPARLFAIHHPEPA